MPAAARMIKIPNCNDFGIIWGCGTEFAIIFVNMTIRNFLDASVERYADRPAQRFYQGGQWVTRPYRALKDRVVRISAVLRDLDLRPGVDNVAIMLHNCPEWEEIYLALACVGITAVPMDARLKKREVIHILNDSQARAIFAGPTFGEMLGITEAAVSGRLLKAKQKLRQTLEGGERDE